MERLSANKIFAKIVIFVKFLKSGKKLKSPSNSFLERDVFFSLSFLFCTSILESPSERLESHLHIGKKKILFGRTWDAVP